MKTTVSRDVYRDVEAIQNAARSAMRSSGGFNNLGEFAKEILSLQVSKRPSTRLNAIRNVETTYSEGTSGTDGGFAIPDDHKTEILNNVLDAHVIPKLCRQMETTSRHVSLATREKQPWQSGGVSAGHVGEGAAITKTKAQLSRIDIELNKKTAFVYASEELLDDAPALGAEIISIASDQLGWEVSLDVLQGLGVNEPLGVLNCPATVTVPKETAGGAQTPDSLVYENVSNMWSRLPVRNREQAVWLCSPDAEAKIWTAQFHIDADPVGHFPGTVPGSPHGSLFGRPVIPHEACNKLGDRGDIILADFNDYALLTKIGGIKANTSLHLAFDQDLMAFRVTLRCGGAPLWGSSVPGRDNADHTRSPFITLAARS